MKDALAERLLVEVMAWTVDDVSTERPYLQAIAAYKYDEYKRFSPGMRFVENLALWLQQFKTVEERRAAYSFVKDRLLFISSGELDHLVASAYPDLIRHLILGEAARLTSRPAHMVAALAHSREFKALRRQSLFLGLSDGAQTDIFRRSSANELRHEQIYQTYEVPDDRADKLQEKLIEELKIILEREPTAEESRFKMVFLLDDFTGSGISYVRKEGDGVSFDGKVAAFYRAIYDSKTSLSRVVDTRNAKIFVVLYISTAQAREYLELILPQMWLPEHPQPRVLSVYSLGERARVSRATDDEIMRLCDTPEYYDANLEDRSTRVGGSHVRYGFADGHLPLVMSHNTPNNSIALLWAYGGEYLRSHRRDRVAGSAKSHRL